MALFVSNHSIWKHTPLQQRISAIDLGGKRIWTIGLEPCDSFIIESYDFDMIVFFVNEKEVDAVWDIDPRKQVHVIVKDCTDEIDVLYKIGTDININSQCHFAECAEPILCDLLYINTESSEKKNAKKQNVQKNDG